MSEETELGKKEEIKGNTVKCTKCGMEIDPTYKACPYCGKKTSGFDALSNWPIIGVVGTVGLSQLLYFIGTIVAIYASIVGGSTMMFVAGIVSLGYIPFGIFELKKSVDKNKSLIYLVLFSFITVFMFLCGMFWFIITH